MNEAAQELHVGKLRLTLLTAIDAALHRRDEVGAVVAAATDRDAAVVAVQDLLGVGSVAANAVLEIPWRRWTQAGMKKLADELSEQARAVGVVLTPHTAWTEIGLPDN